MPENNFEYKLCSDSFTHIPLALYLVATPIGNLNDMSLRAIEVLKKVACILAEDTRHSRQLLAKFGIKKPLISLHEHNEKAQASLLIQRIISGESMALMSDAGTPLISDPGFILVREAQLQNVKVIPIPGPSAVITALSASGLPTDKFVFQGFLPAKKNERQKALESLVFETRTLIFYEAPHRLIETLQDMLAIFGPLREAVVARELTKAFETIQRLPIAELLAWVTATDQARGEIVLLVAGASAKQDEGSRQKEAEKILNILLIELAPAKAAAVTAKITGLPKRELYQIAMKHNQGKHNPGET